MSIQYGRAACADTLLLEDKWPPLSGRLIQGVDLVNLGGTARGTAIFARGQAFIEALPQLTVRKCLHGEIFILNTVTCFAQVIVDSAFRIIVKARVIMRQGNSAPRIILPYPRVANLR